MQTTQSIPREDAEVGNSAAISENVEENIRQALRGLQFGEIVITIRNGNVTQIDRIARKRQFKSNPRG